MPPPANGPFGLDKMLAEHLSQQAVSQQEAAGEKTAPTLWGIGNSPEMPINETKQDDDFRKMMTDLSWGWGNGDNAG